MDTDVIGDFLHGQASDDIGDFLRTGGGGDAIGEFLKQPNVDVAPAAEGPSLLKPWTWRFKGAEFASQWNPETLREARNAVVDPLTTPLAHVPKVTARDLSAQPGTGAKVVAGLNRGAGNLVDFFMSPLGVATLGIGSLPAAGQRAVAGLFAADMMRHVPDQAAALGDAVGRGDTEAATEQTVGLLASAGFSAGAGAKALGLGKRGMAAAAEPAGETADVAPLRAETPVDPKVSPEMDAALTAAEAEPLTFEDVAPTEPAAGLPTPGEAPAVEADTPGVAALRQELEAMNAAPGAQEMRGVNREAETGFDLAEWSASDGKIRKLRAGETGPLAEKQRQAEKLWPDLFSERGARPDEKAQARADYVGQDGSEYRAEDFLDELIALKSERAAALAGHRTELGQASQDAAFQLEAVAGKRKGAVATEPIEAQELAEGDRFTVNGEKVVVERVRTRPDDETMVDRVVVKDGPRFGKQIVPADQRMQIDAGSLERAGGTPAGGDLDFPPAEARTEAGGIEGWADKTIAAARGRVSAGLDPELLAAYAVKGAAVLARGVMATGAWATEMVKAYGEEIREHLPEIRRRAEALLARGWVGVDKPAESGLGERGFPKQVDESSDVSEEVKLRQGPRLYTQRTNLEDATAAAELVRTQGLEGAARLFRDEASDLHGATRMALGMELAKRWGEEEQIAAMSKDAAREARAVQAQVELYEQITRRATDVAQELQSLGMFARLTPTGRLESIRRVVEGAAVKQLRPLRPGLEAIKETVERVNREASGQVVDDPAVAPKVDEAIEGTWQRQAAIKTELARQIAGLWHHLWTESGFWQDLVQTNGMEVMRIAREHYAGTDGMAGRTLFSKLQMGLRLTVKQASALAEAIDKDFAKELAREAKKAAKRAQEEAKRQAARDQKIKGDQSLWEREKAAAAEKLVDAARGRLSEGGRARGPLEEFAGRLAGQLRRELLKRLPERTRAVERLTEEQLLREAAQHPERYNEVWGEAQMAMRKEFEGQPEKLAALDKALGTMAPELFSTPAIDVLLRRELEARKMDLRDLVKEHFTVLDRTGRELSEKIAERLGLEKEPARWVAEAIQKRFEELATARKRAELERMALPARIGRARARGLHEEIIEMSNMGALDEERLEGVVRERLGLTQWTREMAAEAKRRSEEVQKAPEGFQRTRKAIELMNWVERQKGMRWQDLPMSFWFANVLSAPTTHVINMASTATNVAMNVGIAIARTGGRDLPLILESLGRGLVEGAREAKETVATGVVSGARLPKVEALRPLELRNLSGLSAPLKAWRYVFRTLAAEDLLFFKSGEEVRAALAARQIARREGLTGAALEKRTREVLGLTPDQRTAAEGQAAAEGLTGTDRARRVYELMEQGRPAELREDAREFALRATFNQKPTGLLGKIAEAANRVSASFPATRLIMPFTNIVANVTNESLNYFPPVGGARALWGHFRGELEGKTATPEALGDQWAKALIGTAALTAVGVMAARHLDDEDPAFMVTGAGPRTPEQKKQLQETGWVPYSIKVGDKYYTYGWTPFGIGMAALGNYMDGLRYKHLDDSSLMNRLAYSVLTSGKVIVEQSFLSGVKDLMATLSMDASRRSGETALRAVARTATGFVVPSLLKQIDQIFDPTVYDASTVEGSLVAATPFVRRRNDPALNVLGEPVKRYVSSRFVSAARGDAIWDTLAEKQAWVSMPSRDTLVRGQPMDEDQYYTYIERSGTAIRTRLMGSLGLIASSTPKKAREIVERIEREERERVKRTM